MHKQIRPDLHWCYEAKLLKAHQNRRDKLLNCKNRNVKEHLRNIYSKTVWPRSKIIFNLNVKQCWRRMLYDYEKPNIQKGVVHKLRFCSLDLNNGNQILTNSSKLNASFTAERNFHILPWILFLVFSIENFRNVSRIIFEFMKLKKSDLASTHALHERCQPELNTDSHACSRTKFLLVFRVTDISLVRWYRT